jgi:secondary thiamine-phosphate synthase enzyme
MIFQTEITLPVRAKGYHLITNQIIENLPELPEKGILNILLKHTSAAITINENVDPTVRQDFESFMSRLVPEGADDMPAHIKASIIGQSITIPITNSRLNLGTWQGIYLCEFRKHASRRQLVLTVYS